MILADAHVHLHAYPDPAGIVARARARDVHLLVAVSIDLASSRRSIDLAAQFVGVVAAVGFHPSWLTAPLTPADLAALEQLARHPSVGFIGEIGLDGVEAKLSVEDQRQAFRAQLDLADRLSLPVNLHIRDAFPAAIAELAARGLPSAGAVVHYFVGDPALAGRLLDLGLYLSVGKPVIRPENAALRAAIRGIPLDRLLLETDAYPLPGRTTEPADIGDIAREVAHLRGCSLEEVARATTDNLRRLLGARGPLGAVE